jgi:gliding motility-associated lipoprotein GldD
MLNIKHLLLTCALAFAFTACDEDEDDFVSPKPRGYHRIAFADKKYKSFTSNCAYQFEIPEYGVMLKKQGADSCWYDLVFPLHKATLHLSYKKVTNTISQYIEDSRDFAVRHQIKATGLNESVIYRDSSKVYGLLYDIEGNTASSVQFYLTDSTHHFLRGALYFNVSPNIDSLKLVVDYLRKDIIH